MPHPHGLPARIAEIRRQACAPIIARTRAVCSVDPVAEATRAVLLRVERDVHKRGWGKPLRLFMLENDELAEPYIHYYDILTQGLHEILAKLDGDVGNAMLVYADMMEKLRRQGGTVGNMVYERPNPDEDMRVDQHIGRFYGFGIIVEQRILGGPRNNPARYKGGGLWHVDYTMNPMLPYLMKRQLIVICRDGTCWDVNRFRDAKPIATCWRADDVMHVQAGNLVHAMSRITNAIASNPVPILPLDLPGLGFTGNQPG